MTIPAGAAWRVRAGGNNANGSGYNSGTSGVQSTTLNGAITNSATTVVVASATGWPSSGNYYARIGSVGGEAFSSGGTGDSEVVLVTAGQGTTSWTVTRGQLGTTAQAFASGVTVDNELSRCDTAIASGSAATSSNSTTISNLSGANNTWIGNVIYLASGTGVTVGPYFIQSITNGTTIVVDRASGTYTATGVWKVGGAWSDPRTNVTASSNIKPGNTIFVRAGGSGSISSPDYALSSYIQFPGGDSANGYIKLVGENSRPVIKASSGNALVVYNGGGYYQWLENLWLVANGTGFNSSNGITDNNGLLYNCIVDQNGNDTNGWMGVGVCDNCEFLSSTANGGSAGTLYAIRTPDNTYRPVVRNCNIHDCWGPGVLVNGMMTLDSCIIAKNKGDGIVVATTASNGYMKEIVECTIDGNGGHGIDIANESALAWVHIVGNIISNQNQASKYAIRCNFGSAAVNDRLRGVIDNNTFYNNTSNALNLTVSSAALNGHVYDNNIGVDPVFIGQSTENYAISGTMDALGFPKAAFLQSKSGQTTGVRNYMSPGAVQPRAESWRFGSVA